MWFHVMNKKINLHFIEISKTFFLFRESFKISIWVHDVSIPIEVSFWFIKVHYWEANVYYQLNYNFCITSLCLELEDISDGLIVWTSVCFLIFLHLFGICCSFMNIFRKLFNMKSSLGKFGRLAEDDGWKQEVRGSGGPKYWGKAIDKSSKAFPFDSITVRWSRFRKKTQNEPSCAHAWVRGISYSKRGQIF